MKMKRLYAILIITVLMTACKEDPGSYTQIKTSEFLIFQAIKAFRTSNGLNGPFAHQFVMVREAQIYSYKMANNVEELGTQGLTEHWDEIHKKIGGYNDQALVIKSNTDDADEILTQLLLIPDADSILLEDLTQCGVGLESDTAGINFITILLMKVDS